MPANVLTIGVLSKRRVRPLRIASPELLLAMLWDWASPWWLQSPWGDFRSLLSNNEIKPQNTTTRIAFEFNGVKTLMWTAAVKKRGRAS